MSRVIFISFITILRREWLRMVRIWGQVFLPPVITMTLYFMIFGDLLGNRIGSILGIPYPYFIAPGLIMMSIVTNSFANVSSSFYSNRFQGNIQELLVSPTPNLIILSGYVLGGVIRSLIIGAAILVIATFFTFHHIHSYMLTSLVAVSASVLFSIAGFINAMVARNFDDIMLIPTFILTPLTYLGGIFYSVDMLQPFWRLLSLCNPVLYMVNAMRYALTGVSDTNIWHALIIIFLTILVLLSICLSMLNRGVGLKE